MISSDVRLLILPFNPELAERLYAFSINGRDLSEFDYDGVVFASGIKNLSKDNWNKIVTELKLPQSQPFDAKKWQNLKKQQESLMNKAQNVDKQIKDIRQNKDSPPKQPKQPKQAKPQKSEAQIERLDKQTTKQLNRLIQIEKETDKFLPQNLLKLKQRQMFTLTTLHDVASIVGLDSQIIQNIQKSARRASEKRLKIYLKSISDIPQNITVEDIEKRQLELLSNINTTRNKLQYIAKSKGVNLETLSSITPIPSNSSPVDITKLDAQFNALYQNLASVAAAIQETAKTYSVKLENEAETNKYLVPIYNDLESSQNGLIARIEYLNDQARMINPNAVKVNEEILHS